MYFPRLHWPADEGGNVQSHGSNPSSRAGWTGPTFQPPRRSYSANAIRRAPPRHAWRRSVGEKPAPFAGGEPLGSRGSGQSNSAADHLPHVAPGARRSSCPRSRPGHRAPSPSGCRGGDGGGHRGRGRGRREGGGAEATAFREKLECCVRCERPTSRPCRRVRRQAGEGRAVSRAAAR